jgi:hypothetical protein
MEAIFSEFVETLGGRAYLKEVGHWGCDFEDYTWTVFPVPPSASYSP